MPRLVDDPEGADATAPLHQPVAEVSVGARHPDVGLRVGDLHDGRVQRRAGHVPEAAAGRRSIDRHRRRRDPSDPMRRSRRASDAGSAQCGDHSQRMSGPGCPGEKLTVTDPGTPLPTTLDGRTPAAVVAMVPVRDTVALQLSPGTAGEVGTSKTMLPNAPSDCGVPRTTPQPAAPADVVPRFKATDPTVKEADTAASAATRRPNLPERGSTYRTWHPPSCWKPPQATHRTS